MQQKLLPKDLVEHVHKEILGENNWYVGSQFEWAKQPFIWRIYENRSRFFRECIDRARARCGNELRILDAGCGDGYWLTRLQEIPGLRLEGIDYNPLRVERARKVLPDVRIETRDLSRCECTEPYDVILLNQVLEHVEDDVRLLRRVRGMMRPEGSLILGTPNEGAWLQHLWLRCTGELKRTDHQHFYTEKEIRGKLDQAGLAIDSVMREVCFIGSSRAFYWLTRRDWGFRLLTQLTRTWPSQCSDYYFECRLDITEHTNVAETNNPSSRATYR